MIQELDDKYSEQNSFTPEDEQFLNTAAKKYAVIDQSIRVQLLRRILSKQATIKDAAKEFGVNFSTAKAILQTYRREGRIGKKKTRDRKGSSKPDLGAESSSPRKIQSMYNLDKGEKEQLKEPQLTFTSPNLDVTSTKMALAYCQQQLLQQRMLNMQLMMMLQNQIQSQPKIS